MTEQMQTIQQEAEGQETGDGAARTWWRGHRRVVLPALLLLLMVTALTALLTNAVPLSLPPLVDVLTRGDHQQFRASLRRSGAWGPVISLLLMIAQVLLAPIPASVVQLANGVVYGPLWGTLLNIAG